MPTYLCHGFRWHRQSIRIHVVLSNIDDATPEWVIAPRSSASIIESLYDEYDFLPPRAPLPAGARRTGAGRRTGHARAAQQKERPLPPPPSPPADSVLRNDWSPVKLLEEYNPEDDTITSAPWAYVADYAVRIDTSVSITDEIARFEGRQKVDEELHGAVGGYKNAHRTSLPPTSDPAWFERLRDELEKGEEVRWYVVVCGDEERRYSVASEQALTTAPGSLGLHSEELQAQDSGSDYDEDEEEDDEGEYEFRLPEFVDMDLTQQPGVEALPDPVMSQLRPRPLKLPTVEESPPAVPEKDYPSSPTASPRKMMQSPIRSLASPAPVLRASPSPSPEPKSAAARPEGSFIPATPSRARPTEFPSSRYTPTPKPPSPSDAYRPPAPPPPPPSVRSGKCSSPLRPKAAAAPKSPLLRTKVSVDRTWHEKVYPLTRINLAMDDARSKGGFRRLFSRKTDCSY